MYRLWQGMVWLGIFDFIVLLCFPNLLCLRSQIWKRVTFALFVRISAMQIIGSGQIVTFVTSVVPTFFSCIALFWFVSFAFRFLVLLYLLDCAGVFRSCGSDGDAVSRPCKPLIKAKPVFAAAQTFLRKASRLDRNFYMGCALYLRPRRNAFPKLTANFKPPPPKK